MSTSSSAEEGAQKRAPNAALWQDRNFLWLISGGMLSMLGDQFTLLALPWLVLKMTGDSLYVGTVFAAMSIPRAIFILVGGAMVDRTSSKRVLMITKYVNTSLLGLLAWMVYDDLLGVWSIHLLALAIGLTSAFSYPAGSSILPQILPPTLLQPANGVLMGLRQVNQLLGPTLAGLIISLFGDASAGLGVGAAGLALAFLIDCLTFLLSAWTLAQVRLLRAERTESAAKSVLGDIQEALVTLWRDRPLRALCLYYAATAFLIGGPIQVALPLLAERNIDEGAAGFGFLMAAHGCGALVGMVISGTRPRWRIGSLGATILLIDATAGLLFAPLGQVHALWQGMVLLFPLGGLAGFIQVVVFTWMQRRVPPAMIGRAMSIFMFIFMGLSPLSGPLAGWLLRSVSLDRMFLGVAASFFLIVLGGWFWGRVASEVSEAEPVLSAAE